MPQCHGNILFEWEFDEESEPIEIVVCYTLDPFAPQTWESPAEGGGCELWGFELHSSATNTAELIGKLEDRGQSAISQFEAAMKKDAALRDRVEQYCRDDANSRHEECDRD